MKKKLFVLFSFVLLVSLVFISCNKEEQDGITPRFSNEAGTGANPDNTSAGTAGGSTTSTTVGSTSTTGVNPTTTSGSSTSGSTTSGSTTSTTSTTSSTTSGSTTSPPPTGNWYKVNSTLYNTIGVVGEPYGTEWSVKGGIGLNDSCIVTFASIPNAGTYTVVFFPSAPTEVSVAVMTATTAYTGMSGTVTVTILSGNRRRVVFNLPDSAEFPSGTPVTISGDMTTP